MGGRGGLGHMSPKFKFQKRPFLALNKRPCRCWYFAIVFTIFHITVKVSLCPFLPIHISLLQGQLLGI